MSAEAVFYWAADRANLWGKLLLAAGAGCLIGGAGTVSLYFCWASIFLNIGSLLEGYASERKYARWNAENLLAMMEMQLTVAEQVEADRRYIASLVRAADDLREHIARMP